MWFTGIRNITISECKKNKHGYDYDRFEIHFYRIYDYSVSEGIGNKFNNMTTYEVIIILIWLIILYVNFLIELIIWYYKYNN